MAHKLEAGGIYVENLSHYKVEDGTAFSVDYSTNDLTAASYLYLRVGTGSEKCVHMNFSVAVGGSSVVRLFEDSTITAAGTGLTSYGFNRQISGIVHTTTFFVNTAAQVTTTGTNIRTEFIPGGTGVGQSEFGGSLGDSFDMILDTSSTYLLSIENQSGSTITASIVGQYHLE